MGILAAARARPAGAGVNCLLTSSAAARKLVRLARSTRQDREELAGMPEPPLPEGHFRRGNTHLRPTYMVTLSPVPRLPAGAPARACCRRAFLRAAFMTAGDVSIGPTGNHLEFRLVSEAAAEEVARALAALEVRPRTRQRGARWLVYVKGAEDLLVLLTAMGASQGVLRFENELVLREVRAQANRLANSETSNLRRSVASGLRQADVARRLTQSGLVERQPQAIREAAAARLAAPTASLGVMAARMHVSRSAANGRLRRMLAVAEELGLVD
jgi:DNA-binding protein WhiA